MNENENAKTEPHEHSNYMPGSAGEADQSGVNESPGAQKLKLVTKTTEPPEQDLAEGAKKQSYPIASAGPPGGNCTYHSKSNATHICSECKTNICYVCAFTQPERSLFVLCPKCVSKPLDSYPTERKNSLIVAYLMAIISTLCAGFTFSGILFSAGIPENAIGLIIMAFIVLPAIIGSSFGYGAMEANRGNGVAVWLALSWNALVLAGITAIIFIGNFVS